MRIKLDENMPAALAEMLRQAGHDVAMVAEEALSGADDPRLMTTCTSEGRLLITFDTDFGDVRHYPVGTHARIVEFRLKDQRWSALEEPSRRLTESGVLERLRGGLAVVDERRVRMRAGKKEK